MRKVILAFMLAITSSVGAWEVIDHKTIYGTTNETLVLTFYPGEVVEGVNDVADLFKIRLRSVERSEIVPLPEVSHDGITTEYKLHLTIPKTGHWFVDCKACNGSGCSRWASIENKEDVSNGESKWIYGYIAPPTGGGVE